MKNKKLIKEDLFEIYKTLKDITANEVTSKMFSKDFLKKFKYSVEDIYTVLELNNAENIKTTLEIKLNEKIMNIRDLDSLRTFYYQNLAEICNAQVSEEEKKKIIGKISVEELKHLYSIISPIPVVKGKKKEDIVRMLKSYFDDEARTDDINSKLEY